MINLTVGAGMLAIWHDVVSGHEAAVEHWYNSEHHFERLGISGFCEATRYQAPEATSRRYMCLYRTKDPAVLSTAAYLARVNDPTTWTQDIMPLYRNFSRTICQVSHVAGRGRGGWVAALAMALEPGSTERLDPELIGQISGQLLNQQGTLRCSWLARADQTTAQPSTKESRLRRGSNQEIDAAILIDTNHQSQAADTLATLETLLEDASVNYSMRQRGSYQQVFSAT